MDISTKLNPYAERIGASIFFGRGYNYDREKPWSITLEYRDDNLKTEISERGATLDECFTAAFGKLEQLITRGLGASAMLPALEAPKAEVDF